MAISPEQALVGPGWRLSGREERTLAEVEDDVDGLLAQMFAGKEDVPTGMSVTIPLDQYPVGALSLAMQVTLIRRYRGAGWGRVGIDTTQSRYTLTFYRAGL